MFAFADKTDVALMAVGTVSAVANGMAQPVMTFIFGDVINAFSSAGSSPEVLHRVSKVRALARIFQVSLEDVVAANPALCKSMNILAQNILPAQSR
jgi:hypothetical protein